MKNLLLFRFGLLIAAALFGVAVVQAEDLGKVKTRMDQRLGTVTGLKDRGIAGENNTGFLELRGQGTAADQGVIAQENADRRTVYAAIAAQNKISVDAVGRQRAAQIAGIARPGHWIQDANGSWRKK